MEMEKIQDEALHFIQSLDAAAFETFTRGDCTGERYREIAGHIGTIQRLAVEILYGADGMNNTARDVRGYASKTLYNHF